MKCWCLVFTRQEKLLNTCYDGHITGKSKWIIIFLNTSYLTYYTEQETPIQKVLLFAKRKFKVYIL